MRLKFLILCAAMALLQVANAGAADPVLRPSGTVDIDQTRVSFLVSGSGGGGTLHFRGRDYPFSIGGLGIGGIGVSQLKATGEVYNLTDRAKFAGLFRDVRTGIAVGEAGSGKLWLENADGVVLELKGKSQGIALSLGADAVNISFK